MTILAAILTLVSTYIVAMTVFNRLFPKVAGFSRLGLVGSGTLVFLMWMTFLTTWLFGFDNSFLVLAAVGGVAGIQQLPGLWQALPPKRIARIVKGHKIGTLCVLGIICVVGALLHTRMYLPGPLGIYSGGSTWGDLSLHSMLITHFSQSNSLDFDSPIWSGTPNTYPWLFDFYTAWLVRAGFPLRESLLISSWQALLPLATLFIALAKKLSLKKVGLISATIWFFLAGGFGFIYFLPDFLDSGKTVGKFLQQMPDQYTNNSSRGIFFSNPITDILLPQRGALVGIGILLAILLLLQQWLSKRAKRALISAACLIGLLPLIHVHLFLVGSSLLVLTAIIAGWARQGPFPHILWLIAAVIVILAAAPQLLWLISGGAGASFVGIDPLWMYSFSSEQPFGPVSFFFLNFSIAFLLALWSIKYFHSKKYAFNILLYVAMLGILVLSLTIRFQPNPWDNIKFLVVALLIASILAGKVADRWWPKHTLVVITFIFLGSLSGLLSVIREFTHIYPMFNQEEISEVTIIQEQLPAGSVLATAPHHKVPLGILGGYSLYSGYPGWLWTYGINYQARAATLQQAYVGDTFALEKLRSDGVTHMVFSPLEYQEFSVSPQWENVPKDISVGNTFIIELNELPEL